FSVRLANGSEQTFATAQEMAKWIAKQRSLQLPVANRRAARKSAAGRRKVRRSKSHVCSESESPLDRFNRKVTTDIENASGGEKRRDSNQRLK
ncbi:hypothetical protein OAG71_04950, partial [bacterium]|nr:hypothetical protein [bacterium]